MAPESDSSSCSSEDESVAGDKVPETDPVSRQWQKSALHKYVYFRWSTAHNSKNRFKGVVTGHKAKLVAQAGGKARRRDYLVIKTFGMSEDTYVIGKDIREFYVLPSKAQLMECKTDEEIKAIAVRRWTAMQGWQRMKHELDANPKEVKHNSHELKMVQKVPRPAVSQESTAPTTPAPKAERIAKPKPAIISTSTPYFTHVTVCTRHTRRAMASRVPGFAFAEFN